MPPSVVRSVPSPARLVPSRPRIVTIHNGKLSGLIDEPAIARHRLLCVRGSRVAFGNLASDRCGARADPDGDYDCKCKEGYTDAHNISTFENKDSYRKGELCYKIGCKDINGKVHVILLFYTNHVEKGPVCDQAIEYFKQIPGLIPGEANIDLIRWDYHARSYSFSTSNKTVEMEEQLKNETCDGYDQDPMEAMTMARNLFEQKQNESDIRILFSVSNGFGYYNVYFVKEEMIKKLKVNMIFVHNFAWWNSHGHLMKQMINPDKVSTNFIGVPVGSKGMSKDHLEMVMNQQCNPDLEKIV